MSALFWFGCGAVSGVTVFVAWVFLSVAREERENLMRRMEADD